MSPVQTVRPVRVLWRGEPLVVDAAVSPLRVRIYSVHKLNAREPQTFVERSSEGEGDQVVALSAWPIEDRLELYDLVREAWNRGI